MKRIFENDEDSNLLILDEKDITVKYGVYDLYYKNEFYDDNIQFYKDERRSFFSDYLESEEKEKLTFSEAKSVIQDFQSKFEYTCSKNWTQTGRPGKYLRSKEEDFISDIQGYFYDNEGKDEYEGYNSIEVYEYWDGHNWKEIILTTDCIPHYYTEVTNKFSEFEEWECFGYSEHQTGYSEYYFDSGKEIVLEKEVSYFQGSITTYKVIDVLETISEIKNAPNRVIELFNKSLSEIELNKGEQLYIDQNAICFSYKNEEYHFSENQLYTFNGQENVFYIDLDIARQAIKKRRIEAICERFAKNDYASVITLPLSKIFVDFTDSIEAGNCEEISNSVKNKIAQAEKIIGDYAIRADILLLYRDDNYSRRAILQAYKSKYISKFPIL